MSGRIRNVRPKPGYVLDGGNVVPARSNVVPIRDGALTNLLSGRGTSVDRLTHNFWVGQTMQPDQIEAAYRSNWLHRKIVDIPAQDMVRAGRDWDAPDGDIAKIEAEERRLGVWPKLLRGLTLGRLGGGAILIGMGDDPQKPLPVNMRSRQIKYLTVLSRWQLSLGDMATDPASELFGQPTYFELTGVTRQIRIHPSRIVCFKGMPLPAIAMSASWEDRFWGDSVIQVVDEAVQQATIASGGFASLIDEAKVDVFTMPGMYETLSQPGGEAKFMSALQATAMGKSIHRMLALGDGETWEQRQVTWSGMPDVIRTYLSIVAGAADIPATRLLGKSPEGMNATGEHDERNYQQSISSKQEMDLRPCMEQLDAVLLPSAGVNDTDLSWAFSPLMALTAQQQAEIENKEADTVSKLVNAGVVPDAAMAKTVQNRMIESQRWPGLQDAIEKAEAAGEELPEDDPSEIVPVGAQAADALPRPLYVHRQLLNAGDVIAWAKTVGLASTLPPGDMHVTVLYSRAPVDPIKMGESWNQNDKGEIAIRPGGPRAVERLGDDAIVLMFASSELSWRHEQMVRAGASHDYDEYQPHVTLTYSAPEGFDLEAIKPYAGELRFGPELFEPLDLDWKSKVSEA